MHSTPIHRSSRAGFTLVELIVVITILAILGTIGFVSFQGYTSDARNTKRTQDLASISTAIANKKATQSVAITSYVTADPNSTLLAANISLAGYTTTINAVAGRYLAGSVNYTALNLLAKDFQDPSGQNYRMGATTLDGSAYEIAATLEGDTPKAVVSGTYIPRSITVPGAFGYIIPGSGFAATTAGYTVMAWNVPASVTASTTTTTPMTLALSNATDGVNVRVGDKLTQGTTVMFTNTPDIVVSKISGDQKLISFLITAGSTAAVGTAANVPTNTAAAGTSAWNIPTEQKGLISNTNAVAAAGCAPVTAGTPGTITVTDGSTTCLPY